MRVRPFPLIAALLLSGTFVFVGCAAGPQRGVIPLGFPLPNTISVKPPAANVPPELAAYSGWWVGRAETGVTFVFVVEEIDPGSESWAAHAIALLAHDNPQVADPRLSRGRLDFVNGRLRLDESGTRVVVERQGDGTLLLTLQTKTTSGVLRLRMLRAALGPFTLDGIYRGTIQYRSGRTAVVTMALQQRRNETTGSYATDRGDTGTVRGSVSGATFSARLASATATVTCDATGEVSDAGRSLAGSFTCSDGSAGSVVLTRE